MRLFPFLRLSMLYDICISGLPIVAVCGATGTGKSKLAIDIARLFRGEVINADAMQLYEGLEIATNKVTLTEAAGVPHHLLGTFAATSAGRFDVRDYRHKCLQLIEKIRTENKCIPILTGGTHYYLEAVLWSDFLSNDKTSSDELDAYASLDLPTDPSDCYDQLKRINPIAAAQLHPNNVRKVRRALADSLRSDRESASQPGPPKLSREHGPSNRSYCPRYPGQTLIFWTDCDGEVLNGRLDRRVDDMIQAGLVDELDRFLDRFFSSGERNETRNVSDDQGVSDRLSRLFAVDAESQNDPFVRRGILQSIGFKEFTDYLAIPASSGQRNTPEGQKILITAIDRVKIATRQYARRQVRWITNRFLRRPALGGLPIYRIPVSEIFRPDKTAATNSVDWDRLVLAPVARVLYDHLCHSQPGYPDHQDERLQSLLDLCPSPMAPEPCPFLPASAAPESADAAPFICTACSDRVFVRHEDWIAHTKSRSHQKRSAKLRRRALLQTAMRNEPD